MNPNTQFPWFQHYPKGIPQEIDPNKYQSITELFEISCQKFKDKIAFKNFGATLTYDELFKASADFASFLQNTAGLKKGDRIAIQMPNVMQYPVALFGALRAGLVVVNTNPLYTPPEMEHQFNDSGAKAIVILETCAASLEQVLKKTSIETVIVTGVGDMLGWPKSLLINTVIRHVKKMVPKYNLPDAYGWYEALDLGAEKSFTPTRSTHEDIAFLQYTGGTTGVAKGAMLTHRNIISNMLQIKAWISPSLNEGEEIAILALPLYHIFSLTLNGLAIVDFGGTNLMITNPKDIPGFIKTLKKERFTLFPGVNTLFNALLNHPDIGTVDFSECKVAVAGGMALQTAVAHRWKAQTKSIIVEGYGLTETSPVASVNPIDGTDRVGTIGLPLPSTQIRLIDDDEKPLPIGERGEIAIKGPQVMKGYWNRPDETAKVMTNDGWFKSGDIGFMDADGFTKIVDRKKDMILVSGFNVYPNEIEDVLALHPKVLESAAIGVSDDKSGEVVKVFIVKKDPSLNDEEVLNHCKESLAAYKIPKHIEYRKELPKTNVGKILRRALRDEAQ
jgi:long-chain acyl-CoA synthetase